MNRLPMLADERVAFCLRGRGLGSETLVPPLGATHAAETRRQQDPGSRPILIRPPGMLQTLYSKKRRVGTAAPGPRASFLVRPIGCAPIAPMAASFGERRFPTLPGA